MKSLTVFLFTCLLMCCGQSMAQSWDNPAYDLNVQAYSYSYNNMPYGYRYNEIVIPVVPIRPVIIYPYYQPSPSYSLWYARKMQFNNQYQLQAQAMSGLVMKRAAHREAKLEYIRWNQLLNKMGN